MAKRQALLRAIVEARRRSNENTSATVYVVYDPSYRGLYSPYRVLTEHGFDAERYHDDTIEAAYQDGDELI